MNDNSLAPEAQDAADVVADQQQQIDTPAAADTQVADQQATNDGLTADEQTEEDEWGAAADEVFPGLKSANKQEKRNEQKQSEEASKKPEAAGAPQKGASADDGAGTPKGEVDEAGKGGDDGEDDAEEDVQVDTAARDARVAQREYAKELETMRNDVSTALFADRPTQLKDADGDPIRTLEDVMKLINPLTIGQEDTPNGRAFTQEEAGTWLLHNQQRLNEQKASDDAEISRISELQLDIQDQTNSIGERYGEILKADPVLKAELWNDFVGMCETKTAKLGDKDVMVITKMPQISLEKFYERALEPLAAAGRSAEEAQAAQASAVADSNKSRQQQRADRSDIYGGGGIDSRDDDTKEWDAAATAVFSPEQLSGLRKR